MIKAIAFTVYPVSDIARSRRFYENVLGLKLAHNFADQWIEYNIAGEAFAITTMMTDCVPGSKGAGIAFEVDDIEKSVQRMREQKVPFVLELFTTPICRMAVIADPDGNALSLHQLNSGAPA